MTNKSTPVAPGTNLSTIVITIDGPAGAGKSSVARALARHFGFAFLDTGAMYRALTLACIRADVPWEDSAAVAQTARDAKVRFQGNHVLLNDEDVTRDIRTPIVATHIRHVADHPEIRRQLGAMQRELAQGQRIVTEGRDQGTEIFPDATCKFFLTATPETRARRRHAELAPENPELSYEEVLAAQQRRDEEDARRPVGALRAADDAEIVSTDNLSQDEVVAKLAQIVQQRLAQSG